MLVTTFLYLHLTSSSSLNRNISGDGFGTIRFFFLWPTKVHRKEKPSVHVTRAFCRCFSYDRYRHIRDLKHIMQRPHNLSVAATFTTYSVHYSFGNRACEWNGAVRISAAHSESSVSLLPCPEPFSTTLLSSVNLTGMVHLCDSSISSLKYFVNSIVRLSTWVLWHIILRVAEQLIIHRCILGVHASWCEQYGSEIGARDNVTLRHFKKVAPRFIRNSAAPLCSHALFGNY